jgi:succinate dehydrogenase hydrophobic anchor subunit
VSAPADTPTVQPAAWERPSAVASVPQETSSRFAEYVLLRVTGVALAVLVLGHFAMTHFVTDVAETGSAFVGRRLSSALWVGWDGIMLAAAFAHGAAGVRLALEDYGGSRRMRRLLQRGVLVVAAALFAVGTLTLARAAGG